MEELVGKRITFPAGSYVLINGYNNGTIFGNWYIGNTRNPNFKPQYVAEIDGIDVSFEEEEYMDGIDNQNWVVESGLYVKHLKRHVI